jgi:small subunit ribosomal protein S6
MIEEEIKKYESFFEKNEIEVAAVERIGRKRLAYVIKKRQNGFYVCFIVLAPPGTISKVERTYKLDENIIRYLTIFMSARSKREKEEHLKNKALIQSKFEESKEKQNSIAEPAAETTPLGSQVQSTEK